MDDAELVNKPLEAWTKWALVWLTVFPFVGILVSIRFHNREFLGGMPLFTFGRLRSVHLGGVLFGPLTSALIALFYYCSAVRHAAVQSGVRMVAALIWNAFLTFGSLSLCMGYMVGVAPEPHVIYRRRDCGHSDLGTISRRRASRFYVSPWYALAAGIWLFSICHWAPCSCPMAL